MTNIERLLKWFGRMEMTDSNGNVTIWLWDYANDKARRKSNMTQEEILISEQSKTTHHVLTATRFDEGKNKTEGC